MKTNLVVLICIILAASMLVIGAGCQSNTPVTNNGGNTGGSGGASDSVIISNFAFNPGTSTVHVGDTVTWTNQDSATHTITSDSGSELSSGQISSGHTYAHTFMTAGIYAYHCSIHTSMKGTIIVQ